MKQPEYCEFCGRPIRGEPEIRVVRGVKHVFCTGFCFRLFFYDVPTISYEELQKMYSYYCVSLPAEDYYKTVSELTVEEDSDGG
jgi:hypothetical protein